MPCITVLGVVRQGVIREIKCNLLLNDFINIRRPEDCLHEVIIGYWAHGRSLLNNARPGRCCVRCHIFHIRGKIVVLDILDTFTVSCYIY